VDKNLLIPAALSAILVVVLVGMFLGGAFTSSGGLDKSALERVVAATGWRVSQARAGSRDVTTLAPADGSWEIVLRTSERTGSRGTGGASSVFTTGGSGTAWHAASPSFPGFLAVAPGEPVPEGAVNDLLGGPRGAMLAAVLPRVMRDLAGGDVPAPARLVGFRSGDAGFDASYTLVADDPAWAAGLLGGGGCAASRRAGRPRGVVGALFGGRAARAFGRAGARSGGAPAARGRRAAPAGGPPAVADSPLTTRQTDCG